MSGRALSIVGSVVVLLVGVVGVSECVVVVGGGKLGCCRSNEIKLGENIDKPESNQGLYCFFA